MESLIGKTLGHYKVLELLGQGGMSTVYKAYDTNLDREVAIKIIRRDAFPPEQTDQLLKRFEREAKALAHMVHPHIVNIIDYGSQENNPYLVMNYLSGGSLKDRMGKPIAWQEVVRLLEPIAEALDYAHSLGIVHRDVKPGNILLTERGQPMLTDFGVAKLLESEDAQTLTGTGLGIGTPEYMAPEQWSGKVSPQTDIYSLGVVCYEMITGKKPYIAATPAEILLKQATEPLPEPRTFVTDLPEKVEQILKKSIAKNPSDRYATMGEFATALADVQGRRAEVQPAPGVSKDKAGLPPGSAAEATRVNRLAETAPVRMETTRKPGFKLTWKVWLPAAVLILLAVLGVVFGGGLINPGKPVANTPPSTSTSVQASTDTILPTTQASIPASPVILSIWDDYYSGSSEDTTFKTIVAEYTSAHPNVTIKVTEMSSDQIFTKYEAQVAAGTGPDMFTSDSRALGNEARAGLIAPIDDLVTGKLDGYTPVSIETATVNGKIYAVPGIARALGLYYNKSTIPNPPQTTTDLLNLVNSGKKLGLLKSDYDLYGFWSAFGGTLMDSSGKCIADQGGFADALQYFVTLKNSGAEFDTDQTKIENAFLNGQLDMIIGGSWEIHNLRNGLGTNLGLVALPVGPKGPSKSMIDISGWYFNPKSTNQQAAVDFALYAFSSHGLTLFANNVGDAIARTDIAFSDPLVQAFTEYAASGEPRPENFEFNNYWVPFGDMITAVLSGNTTPQNAVTTACQQMNAANNK